MTLKLFQNAYFWMHSHTFFVSTTSLVRYKTTDFLHMKQCSNMQIISVATELRFCPLLHTDWFKTCNNTLPVVFNLSSGLRSQ